MNQPSMQQKSSKIGLWVGLSILLTALVVGGGVYAWQQMKLDATKNDLQKQVDTLKTEVSQIENEKSSSAQKDMNSTTNNDPSKDTTSDSRIYTMQRFGVSFEYPKDYKLITTYENTDQNFSIIILDPTSDDAQYKNSVEGSPVVSLSVYKNPDNLTPLEWARKNKVTTNFESIDMQGTYKTETILGEQAITYTWHGLFHADSIVLEKNDHILFLSVDYSDPADAIRADFRKIVDSIEFKN